MVSREMLSGDGEREARRNIYGIRSVGRIYYYYYVTDNAALYGTRWGSLRLAPILSENTHVTPEYYCTERCD